MPEPSRRKSDLEPAGATRPIGASARRLWGVAPRYLDRRQCRWYRRAADLIAYRTLLARCSCLIASRQLVVILIRGYPSSAHVSNHHSLFRGVIISSQKLDSD